MILELRTELCCDLLSGSPLGGRSDFRVKIVTDDDKIVTVLLVLLCYDCIP